ncbi:MAG: metallophosphoesterase [Lachnospiraceae bacterium]|nr:metallophosphoesterase [Lachnospiraceae bacterium]
MKVCCIGDIHGTDKFLQCYEEIIKNDNDCGKIIVFGDHFDPYEDISITTMITRYNKFIETCHKDNRIISLLGNHDLSYYVLHTDKTNRTSTWNANMIRDEIYPNLEDSYLCYIIGDWIFSHAGVSKTWFNDLDEHIQNKLMNNQKGWTPNELKITRFYEHDVSGCGDDENQSCTWIRPYSLIDCPLGEYNQVVAHTRVHKFEKIKMKNDKDLWLVDNDRKPSYLTLEIENGK